MPLTAPSGVRSNTDRGGIASGQSPSSFTEVLWEITFERRHFSKVVLHLVRFAEQIRPVLHVAVESRIMDEVSGFGFTRALIFPYDELHFCHSGTCLSARLAFRLRWGRNALFL